MREFHAVRRTERYRREGSLERNRWLVGNSFPVSREEEKCCEVVGLGQVPFLCVIDARQRGKLLKGFSPHFSHGFGSKISSIGRV